MRRRKNCTVQMCVVFANVTDPFNITIHNTEQSLLRMLERYL